MTRRMFFGVALTPLAARRTTATSLPVRGWSYWHARHPRMQTGMQQPGRHSQPLGLLTTPGYPAQLVWRHQ